MLIDKRIYNNCNLHIERGRAGQFPVPGWPTENGSKSKHKIEEKVKFLHILKFKISNNE